MVVIFLLISSLFTLSVNGEGISAETSQPTIKQNKDYFTQDTYQLEPSQTPQKARSEAITPKEVIMDYITLLWGKDAKTMIKIFECESGLNENSVNYEDAKLTGYNSLGISQLNRPEFEGWDNYKTNLDEAFKLWQKRGKQPWSCRNLI